MYVHTVRMYMRYQGSLLLNVGSLDRAMYISISLLISLKLKGDNG